MQRCKDESHRSTFPQHHHQTWSRYECSTSATFPPRSARHRQGRKLKHLPEMGRMDLSWLTGRESRKQNSSYHKRQPWKLHLTHRMEVIRAQMPPQHPTLFFFCTSSGLAWLHNYTAHLPNPYFSSPIDSLCMRLFFCCIEQSPEEAAGASPLRELSQTR